MKFTTTLLVLVLALTSNLFAISLQHERDGARRYFKQLKRIPANSASYSRILKIAKTLTRLAPEKAPKYFIVGRSKLLAGIVEARTDNLGIEIMKIVDRADLSLRLKKRIIVKISNYIDSFDPGPPPLK